MFGVFGISPLPSPSIPTSSPLAGGAGWWLINKLTNSARLGSFFHASTGLESLHRFGNSGAGTEGGLCPHSWDSPSWKRGKKFLESEEIPGNDPKSLDLQWNVPLEGVKATAELRIKSNKTPRGTTQNPRWRQKFSEGADCDGGKKQELPGKTDLFHPWHEKLGGASLDFHVNPILKRFYSKAPSFDTFNPEWRKILVFPSIPLAIGIKTHQQAAGKHSPKVRREQELLDLFLDIEDLDSVTLGAAGTGKLLDQIPLDLNHNFYNSSFSYNFWTHVWMDTGYFSVWCVQNIQQLLLKF